MATPQTIIRDFQEAHPDYTAIDFPYIARAAAQAANRLATTNVDRTALEPGDMTRYDILIAAPLDNDDLIVGLINLSQRTGRWNPYERPVVTPQMAFENWTDQPWTAHVLAIYLTLVAWHWMNR